jgi:hypothetical protein
MPKSEWMMELANIITTTRLRWAEAFPDRPFKESIFCYDNPSFHNLTKEEAEYLVRPGELLDSADQRMNLAPYSGNLMQCIEHVLAIICNQWMQDRFREGDSMDVQLYEAELSGIFYKKISAEGVSSNVEKLWLLLYHLQQDGTGGYEPVCMS